MDESRQTYVHTKFKKSRKSLIDKYINDEEFLNEFSMDSELPFLFNSHQHRGVGVETSVMRAFSIRLCLENIPRLTEYYNVRCLPALQTHFPQFFHDLQDKGSPYAQEASLPCEMKDCSAEQFDQQIEAILGYQQKPQRVWNGKDYKAFRDAMRDDGVAFEPMTSKLIVLLSRGWDWQPPVHNALMSYIDVACDTYINSFKYPLVNDFLRCIRRGRRGDDYETFLRQRKEPITMARCLTDILPGILLPFTTDSELVVYRADQMTMTTDFFVVKGILSTSLIFSKTNFFGDHRKLKIVMPPGTPFLPMIIFNSGLAEIALLPGTELELVEEKSFREGIYAEYRVTKNPPAFTDVEVATILRASVCSREGSSISEHPSEEDTLKYFRTLVNRKYGGDW